MAPTRPYDLFISYTHADKQAIEPLFAALNTGPDDARLHYFRDIKDINDQQSITRRINQDLANSRIFLAWYSKSYPTSRACQWELTAAYLAATHLQDDADAVQRRMYIFNPEQGVEHILPRALRDRWMKPADQMSWPERVETLKQALKYVEKPFGQLRAFDRPQWYPGNEQTGSGRFVGRGRDLWALHDRLHEHELAAVVASSPGLVQVQGMGGVGKTLLLQEYARRYGRAYPGGIFWLSATNSTVDIALAQVATALGIEAIKADATLAAVKAKLNAIAEPYLWVVDDLPITANNKDLVAWRAPTPNGFSLLTTRSTRLAGQGFEHRLDQLDSEAALELLTSHRKPVGDDQQSAKQILEKLGNHALAVDVAGAICRDMGYRDFLAQLDNPQDDVLADLDEALDHALPTGCSANIAKTLQTSLDRLPPESLTLLTLTSLLAPAPIPESLLKAIFTDYLGDAGKATLALTKGRNGAKREALTETIAATATAEASLSVHILVSRVVQRQQRPEAGKLREAALAVLLKLFQANANDIHRHDVLLPVLSHARELTRDLQNQTGIDLLASIGSLEYERGHYAQARDVFIRELKARRDQLDPELEHPNTLASMNNLALTHWSMGKYAEARDLQQEVLERNERILGPEHPYTRTGMNNLALTLGAIGDHEGAKKLQQEVLNRSEHILGLGDLDTLRSMNNLAVTRGAIGDHAGARELQEQVLTLIQRIQGPEHPHTLLSMSNLAGTLLAIGDHTGARDLHQKVLTLSQRILEPEHPGTLTSMYNLAYTHLALNNRPAAIALVTEALPIALHKHGPTLPVTKALQKLARQLRLNPTPPKPD